MRELRDKTFFAVLAVFVGTLLVASYHSIDDEGSVTSTGPAVPMPTETPADDIHLLLPPDAADIGASGQEYRLFSPLPYPVDLALSSRDLRFTRLRTGETATDTGHACEELAVREVSISREGDTVSVTVSVDRDPGDSNRRVHLRMIGSDGSILNGSLHARGYRDRDGDGAYGRGDTPAVSEISFLLQTLTIGRTYVVLASVHPDFPNHATRSVSWTAGQEDEMTPDPATASRIQVLSPSFVTIASCQPRATAHLLLIDGESIAAGGTGGRILRDYDVTTSP